MTWHQGIGAEIADMFTAYAWRVDDMQRAIEEHVARVSADRRARDAARAKDPKRRKMFVAAVQRWRESNRDQARRLSREQSKRTRARAKVDPEFGAKYRARISKYKKRRHEREPEKVRALWRERQQRYRDKKRQQAAQQQARAA